MRGATPKPVQARWQGDAARVRVCDLIPDEEEARASGHRVGLWAVVPGRRDGGCYLGPVVPHYWTGKTAREAAALDARDLLAAFGRRVPGLRIEMRGLASGAVLFSWGGQATETT